MSEPFVGEIRLLPYTFAPRGWAYCDGQLLPISSNTSLFSLLGTTYGGDGRTTFGLPNIKDRAAMSDGRGTGLSSYRLGQSVGAATVSLQESNLPAHNHTTSVARLTGTSGEPSGSLIAGIDNDIMLKPYVKDAGSKPKIAMASSALANSGGSQPHENRQPYLVLPFCIALMGIYPSRS